MTNAIGIRRIEVFRFSILILILVMMCGRAVAQDSFSLPAPNNLSTLARFTLWATQYYVSVSNNSTLSVPAAFPLLGRDRAELGAALVVPDWCSAALEGTTQVVGSTTTTQLFNYFGLDADHRFQQADCTPFYPNLAVAGVMTRTLFVKGPPDAPYGLGDQSYYRLVPFRSIAVDRSRFPAKSNAGEVIYTVLYIPGLRGARVELGANASLTHDGYVMAVDTGGAITGDHIDVFTGTFDKDFAPSVIKSVPSATFDAYLVTDATTLDYLKALHVRVGQ